MKKIFLALVTGAFLLCATSCQHEPAFVDENGNVTNQTELEIGNKFKKVSLKGDKQLSDFLTWDSWELYSPDYQQYRFRDNNTFSLIISPTSTNFLSRYIFVEGTWEIVDEHLHIYYNRIVNQGYPDDIYYQYVATLKKANNLVDEWKAGEKDKTPKICFYEKDNQTYLYLSSVKSMYKFIKLPYNTDEELNQHLVWNAWEYAAPDYRSYRFRSTNTFNCQIRPNHDDTDLSRFINVDGKWEIVNGHLHLVYNMNTFEAWGYSQAEIDNIKNSMVDANRAYEKWKENPKDDGTFTPLFINNSKFMMLLPQSNQLFEKVTLQYNTDSEIKNKLIGNAWEGSLTGYRAVSFAANGTFTYGIGDNSVAGVKAKIRGTWSIKDGHIHMLYNESTLQDLGNAVYAETLRNEAREANRRINEINATGADRTPTVTFHTIRYATFVHFSNNDYMMANVYRNL